MYTESGEGLGCALAKAYITDCLGFSAFEDVIYRVWDIVPCEIINAVGPKG